ncbi:MAG: Na+/H+ antiporter NhaC family protein [Acidobacteriota bacterium]
MSRPAKILAPSLALGLLAFAAPAYGQSYEIESPAVVLTQVPFAATVRSDQGSIEAASAATFSLKVSDATYDAVPQEDGTLLIANVLVGRSGTVSLELVVNGATVSRASARAVPGWVSIIPPVLAIFIALAFKNVIPALFLGVWVGAWAATGFSILGAWTGMLDTFQVYVLQALADPDHAAIILFSMMIGGMVGIISRNGGMQGVVDRIAPWASSATRGQVAAGVLGLIIFFDDYANTLVVGNTMRKVTDRLRISREKLAYIVDSTAAPVTCVALVTTWIGYEVGLIGTAVAQIDGLDESAYSIFLNSIPYSYYPLLAMFFVFVVAYSRRDFGPMYHAELRARTTGQLVSPEARLDEAAVGGKELQPKEGKAHRAINAILPVLVLVATVLVGLYATGEGDSLHDIIGSSDSYKALMWASLLAALTASALSLGQRILTLGETVEAWYAGLKSMMFAMIILILAWSLSSITAVLHTAGFLVSVLGETLPAAVVPALVFILSAATSFATGSSWGTMGILMPLVVPLTWAVLLANNMADPVHYHILYSTIACVLAGAVWGDHCSPISDTTILSSMASGSDHIDHVRTQLPYALLVGSIGVFLGTLPAGFGAPWWLALIVGAAVLVAAHYYLGKPVEGVGREDEQVEPA